MATINPLTPVAGEIKPLQSMSLGDMMNVARGAQQYQQAAQANPLELQRLQAEANVATGTEQPRISASKSAAETAATGSQSASFDFANKQTIGIANRLTPLINNPLIIAAEQNPGAVDPLQLNMTLQKYATEQADALGIPKDKAMGLIQPYLDVAKNTPAGIRQFLKDKLLTTLDQGSRATIMQPSGIGISTGAGGATVQTGMFGATPPGMIIPGTAFETQIPPTQQIVTGTGQTQLIGPMSQRGNAPMITGLPTAQAAINQAGGVNVAGDLKTTIDEAAAAPGRIGIFQNIKSLAPDAFTGVGGARKELAAGVAQAIGLTIYETEKIATEELRKNSALLALAGGNTDAARALAEVANPNTKLNERAIKGIADQLIGIENMKVARAVYLTPVANDAVSYAKRQQEFNSISDPKLFQEMSNEEVKKLAASMSPAAQQEMLRKIKLARQFGVIK